MKKRCTPSRALATNRSDWRWPALPDTCSRTVTGKRLRAIQGEQLDLLGLDEARGLLYVAHDTGNLGVIAIATGTVLGYSPIVSLPFGLVVDRTTGHIFVANAGEGTVSVLAPRSH